MMFWADLLHHADARLAQQCSEA